MPIYEYACKECGHRFDALQKMNADPLTDCPECGKPGLKKLLSAPNCRLKGGGWYETDFKKENRRNLVEGADKPSAKGAETSGKASDDSAKKGTTEKGADKKSEKTSGSKKTATGKPAGGKSGSI